MERKNVVLARGDMQLVDGKVVITSEELAKAIQDYDVNVNEEEAAEDVILNWKCPITPISK